MQSEIARLFSVEVAVAEGEPRLVDDELYPEERAYLERAVAKRRAEFGTARVLARRALAKLSAAPRALVPNADRAPVWPEGFTGSIAHTADHCVVVVGRSPPHACIGVDVERLQTLDDAMTRLVLTEREQGRLRAEAAARREHFAVVAFSCKEAFYKCQYPVSRGFLEFRDVELELSWEAGTFVARVLKPDWPARVSALTGRFIVRAQRIVAAVELF